MRSSAAMLLTSATMPLRASMLKGAAWRHPLCRRLSTRAFPSAVGADLESASSNFAVNSAGANDPTSTMLYLGASRTHPERSTFALTSFAEREQAVQEMVDLMKANRISPTIWVLNILTISSGTAQEDPTWNCVQNTLLMPFVQRARVRTGPDTASG